MCTVPEFKTKPTPPKKKERYSQGKLDIFTIHTAEPNFFPLNATTRHLLTITIKPINIPVLRVIN